MSYPDLANLAPEQDLTPHDAGPASRWVLAMFAGGSGDHNPMHIDSDFAKIFGREDVFAQGMLSMAYLAQFVRQQAPQEKLRNFKARFTAITPVNANIKCEGRVLEHVTVDGEPRVRIGLRTSIDDGTVTMEGEAVIATA